MRNGKLRAFLIALMLLVFAAGLIFVLYPYLWGAMVDETRRGKGIIRGGDQHTVSALCHFQYFSTNYSLI